MSLRDWLDAIPDGCLSRELRDAQDRVVGEVQGDIYSLIADYKLICVSIRRHRVLPKFVDMPDWLRGHGDRVPRLASHPLTVAQHSLLRARIEAIVEDLATPAIRHVSRIKNPGDEDAERRRRVRIYSRQWRDTERRFGSMVDSTSCRQGSKAKAVWCKETFVIGRTIQSRERTRLFDSLRDAARYATRVSDEPISRAKIRHAIRNGKRCVGRLWGFSDAPAKYCRTGRERAVVCETTGRHFDTQERAAAYAGVSRAAFSIAMRGDGVVLSGWDVPSELRFAFVGAGSIRGADVPAMARAA